MSFRSNLFVSKFVKLPLISSILFVLIQTYPAYSISPDCNCECVVKTEKYLKDFNLTSIAAMQNFTGVSRSNGELNQETCDFVKRRWQNPIVHWRHLQTPFFTKKISEHLTANNVSEVLKKASERWSEITNLTLIEVDSKHAEIQFSFVEKKSRTCNNRTNGERSLNDFNEIIGCAHLPGYQNAGHVQFYDVIWYMDQSQPHENGHSLLAAAIHAFGYALGMNKSAYEDTFQGTELLRKVRTMEKLRFTEQKLYTI